MKGDGSDVKQLTSVPGYDGGAFFSEDCSKVIWRSSRPTGAALADYQRLLGQHLVRPTSLEIMVADVAKDQTLTNIVQVTNNGKANFAPYMHPDNKRLLYVSNKGDPRGRDFDVYMVNSDGSGEERITTNPSFDGFPMFSPDGKKLVFSSNRANATAGDTNVFMADWVD
jgi:Tol biopolymer transport system component